jgi:hypothetical protein
MDVYVAFSGVTFQPERVFQARKELLITLWGGFLTGLRIHFEACLRGRRLGQKGRGLYPELVLAAFEIVPQRRSEPGFSLICSIGHKGVPYALSRERPLGYSSDPSRAQPDWMPQ